VRGEQWLTVLLKVPQVPIPKCGCFQKIGVYTSPNHLFFNEAFALEKNHPFWGGVQVPLFFGNILVKKKQLQTLMMFGEFESTKMAGFPVPSTKTPGGKMSKILWSSHWDQ